MKLPKSLIILLCCGFLVLHGCMHRDLPPELKYDESNVEEIRKAFKVPVSEADYEKANLSEPIEAAEDENEDS